MPNLERLKTSEAAPVGGHYAQGVAWNDLVFVSGQLPITPQGCHQPDTAFDDQARLALQNLVAVLKEGGSDVDHVLKVTAYIVGVANWPPFNAIFAEIFGAALPARAIVPVPELHHGYLVEVEALAVRA
jgi:2-iminobutanoate/2-iminopropanoate deaminase